MNSIKNTAGLLEERKLIIREAEPEDIFALTQLMNELGYDTTIDEMKIRFENIQSHKDYKTFVLTIDTQVSGMMGLTKNYFYEQNGIYIRVLAPTSPSGEGIRVHKYRSSD